MRRISLFVSGLDGPVYRYVISNGCSIWRQKLQILLSDFKFCSDSKKL